MYVLRRLSKLNDLPDALRNRIFRKLFEQAKIANMSKVHKVFHKEHNWHNM